MTVRALPPRAVVVIALREAQTSRPKERTTRRHVSAPLAGRRVTEP